MTEEDKVFWVFGISSAAIAAVLAGSLVAYNYRQEAIRAGVACYDSQTGDFKFITKKVKDAE